MDALKSILIALAVAGILGAVGASDAQEEASQAAREASWPRPVDGDVEDF